MTTLNTRFPATRWSLVKQVQSGTEEEAQRALEVICRNYWYPVYAFLRRSGRSEQDAEDITQAFFLRLVEEKALTTAEERFGRLRSYLLGVLKHLLSDLNRSKQALKRGGAHTLLPFSEVAAEELYKLEPADIASPDLLYDRAWAMRVIDDAKDELKADFAKGSNSGAFEYLGEFLPGGANATPYRAVAKRMGITEGAVALQVHRMRQRYRQLVEDAVGRTVTDESEIENELAHLMISFGK